MFNRGSCNIFGDALIVYGITFLQIFIKKAVQIRIGKFRKIG